MKAKTHAQKNQRRRKTSTSSTGRRGEDTSLLIVFTGNGKGKTSAAITTALRTVAHGGRAAMVQFLKSPKGFVSGDRIIARKIRGFDVFTMGAGFTWNTKDRALDRRTTLEAWAQCTDLVVSGRYNLVVWDEINYVIDYGLLPLEPVLDFLRNRPSGVHIILTGRKARREVIRLADMVTEMKDIKHPFRDRGLPAQKGIDY